MIITTNITGIYVFDDGKLKENISFQLNELIKVNEKLENQEWLEQEKSLAKKYKDSIYIGFKKDKIEGIKVSQDPKKIKFLAEYFAKQTKKFKFVNMLVTKDKVKKSTTDDLLIIQSIKSIEDMQRSFAMLIKRLREWYEIYNPEFSTLTQDHDKFLEMIVTSTRKELLEKLNFKEELSMGSDLGKEDVNAILDLAKQMKELQSNIVTQEKYLEMLMQKTCPNTNAICGHLIGAKLIELAGGLEELSKFPAGTIQLLGAEKALFRHIRSGTKPPKHGIIVTHPYVSKAKNRGKAARVFANKIAIASKVDYYKGEFVGDKLKRMLEK